jgi:hypothetical protein
MTTTMKLAKSVEKNLNDYKKLGFTMKQACLYGVDTDGLIALGYQHNDVYELLDGSDVADLLTVYSHVAVATTGWASPIVDDDDEANDVPPSEHKDRRRVRLVVVADKDSMASVLRFSDEPDHIITDEGKALGSLADALMEATNKAPSAKPWDFLVGDDNE